MKGIYCKVKFVRFCLSVLKQQCCFMWVHMRKCQMSLSSCLQEGHRWSQGEGGIWRPREVTCHYEQHNVALIVGWEQATV